MTSIDHHSKDGDSNCTNATIATVKCACAAAADGALVLLQRARLLEHVAILSLLLYFQSVHCVLRYLEHRHNIFTSRKDGTVAFFFLALSKAFLALP